MCSAYICFLMVNQHCQYVNTAALWGRMFWGCDLFQFKREGEGKEGGASVPFRRPYLNQVKINYNILMGLL